MSAIYICIIWKLDCRQVKRGQENQTLLLQSLSIAFFSISINPIMDSSTFRTTVGNAASGIHVGQLHNQTRYVVPLDKTLANAIFALANELSTICVSLLWALLQLLIMVHQKSIRKARSSLEKSIMTLTASHRGWWRSLFDTISVSRRKNGRRSVKASIITFSVISALLCHGLLYGSNFIIAGSNQGAISIFSPDSCIPPFNWSAPHDNKVSSDVEHIARGSDYDKFDPWAREISLELGQRVGLLGSASAADFGLEITRQSGCWFGDHLCLNGTLGNLEMHFRADTSQLGVLSQKKVWIEGRSRISQFDVDKWVEETSQTYSNTNATTIELFEFGSHFENGKSIPLTWPQFSVISTTHDTDSTTFWADTSGRLGNYSFPEGFNLIDAHLTLIFLPSTSLPHVNGSRRDSLLGAWDWDFPESNITMAYNRPRLLVARDDARLCVRHKCTEFGGADQITPSAERLLKEAGIPRDFVWLSAHAADGMISGPVRLLRNKALMVNDFVAEGNTLDVSSYTIPEIVRWFSLSAAATAALPGRIASGYFSRNWVVSGVTGGTTPPVTEDSIANMTGQNAHTATDLCMVVLGVDERKQLIDIIPFISIIASIFLLGGLDLILGHWILRKRFVKWHRYIDLELLERLSTENTDSGNLSQNLSNVPEAILLEDRVARINAEASTTVETSTTAGSSTTAEGSTATEVSNNKTAPEFQNYRRMSM